MMHGKRLSRLEAKRPALGVSLAVDMAGLAADVMARVAQAKSEGNFLRSLRDADLQAVGALANEQGAI